jgi:crotonobetainyl-CoA:carnitine CoA-transferase CaiB-like acyl-CoA transferase
MAGALSGVRVLDFSQYLAGPFAASKLGDLGADVIKVERPIVGDAGRAATAGGVRLGGESPTFLAFNRSKRSVAVDLGTDKGREVIGALVQTADVIISNFRPGVMTRLGLDYEQLVASNPRLICVQATGYGTNGPLVTFPGQDLLVQAMSGLASVTGRAGDPPTACGAPIADVTMAHQIAFGVSTALFAREKTGLGQLVEVDLLSGLIDAQCHFMAIALNSEQRPTRSSAGIAAPFLAAPYGMYQTSDGYIALAHTPLPILGELLGLEELKEIHGLPQSFIERDHVYELLSDHFLGRSSDHWLELLRSQDLWCAPVLTHDEIVEHEQVAQNDMIVDVVHPTAGSIRLTGIPVKLSRTPGEVVRPAPLLGEHTKMILKDLGYAESTLDALAAQGVIQYYQAPDTDNTDEFQKF